jgi:YHS domain-containing protein
MFRNFPAPFRLFVLSALLILVFNSLIHAGNVLKGHDNDNFGVAINGYDSVAYFTEGRAVKGNEKYSFSWNEAVWYFSNAEHRELFAVNPKKYVPHRGGW